jgi:hypothetical protein
MSVRQMVLTAEYKKNIRRWASQIIHEKRPDVVLCIWQDKDRVTLRMIQVRSLGIGKKFGASKIPFGGGLTIERVNAFHPSYAVNYNPHFSCFRQLLLLEIAKACHTYDGKWREDEWMRESSGISACLKPRP